MNFFHQAFSQSHLSVGELADLMGYCPSTVNGLIGPKADTLTRGCRSLDNIRVKLSGIHQAFVEALDISPAFIEAWAAQERQFKQQKMRDWRYDEIYDLPAVEVCPFAHQPPHFRSLRAPKLAAHIAAVKRAIRCGHVAAAIFQPQSAPNP